MATLNTTLFFRNNRNYNVGGINLDIILSENYNFSSTISQFNVEDGSDISDHIRKNLFTGDLTARVTNFSLFDPILITNKAQNAYDQLKQIWQNRQLVDIVMIYDIFSNVAITNISTPRSPGIGESIEFSISFQEFNLVKLQEVTLVANIKLSNMNSSNNKQASTNLNVGKTTGVIR